jgi:hypothetical protein
MRLVSIRHGVVLLVLFAGCNKPHQASIHGTVTLDSQPLAIGVVTFTPAQDGPVAIANIQPDGSYSVYTGDQEGLDPGEYRVTVAATEMPEATPQNPEPLPKLLTPARYSDPNTSGLSIKVVSGRQRYDISLQSK